MKEKSNHNINNSAVQSKSQHYEDSKAELEILERRQRIEHQRDLDKSDIMKRTLEMM
jgi:hypothetical protein